MPAKNIFLGGRSLWAYFLAFALTWGADALTKIWVTNSMSLFESRSVLGSLIRLTYVRNTGAAFSLLADQAAAWRLPLLVGIALSAIVLVTLLAFREQRLGWKFTIPLGMVAGGAAGNVTDRILSGTVVDFIEVTYKSFHWPVFNLADSAVVIGVGWLIWLTWFNKHTFVPPHVPGA
jgi:signal peptidase II